MTKSNAKEKSVPFSCCNLEVIKPCSHTLMTEENIKTINVKGCAKIISNILLRIVFVAYAMGIMLVLTQSFLVVCIFKVFQINIICLLVVVIIISCNNNTIQCNIIKFI